MLLARFSSKMAPLRAPFRPENVARGRIWPQGRSARVYSTKVAPKTRNWRVFKIGLVVGLGGGLLYATNQTFHDTTRHLALTVERVSVVTVATFRCFRLYKDTLDQEYDSEHERNLALKRTHKRAAYITLKALETNGGIYIKIGQHIAALTYLLPEEWTTTMIPLQDRCPQATLDEIRQMFLSDMGITLDEMFSEFDPNPVGVASLAQVHIATVRKTGQKVAVKVQHPSLKEFVPVDIGLTRTVFELMRKAFPEYPLTWLGEEMQESIYVELDFTNEATNAQNTAKFFENRKNLTALKIPKIVDAHPRILIMECVKGARLDDLKYMESHNINTAEVSACLSHLFNSMIFEPGAGLHCDPHGGNLAIRALSRKESQSKYNFEIILYDHGLYRNIPLQMKRDYAHFWLAVLDRDVPEMKRAAEKFGGIKGDQKFKIFLAAITGRDPDIAMNYDTKSVRTREEAGSIQQQLHNTEGALEDLMYILSTMPRMILLILKTNDLTRNLDENLDNPLGPERTFLILARYCAETLYGETQEAIRTHSNKYSWRRISQTADAWWRYQRRVLSLYFYDLYIKIAQFKNSVGL